MNRIFTIPFCQGVDGSHLTVGRSLWWSLYRKCPKIEVEYQKNSCKDILNTEKWRISHEVSIKICKFAAKYQDGIIYIIIIPKSIRKNNEDLCKK